MAGTDRSLGTPPTFPQMTWPLLLAGSACLSLLLPGVADRLGLLGDRWETGLYAMHQLTLAFRWRRAVCCRKAGQRTSALSTEQAGAVIKRSPIARAAPDSPASDGTDQ